MTGKHFVKISWPYFSPWEMHSNENKHALYCFIHSWNSCSVFRCVTKKTLLFLLSKTNARVVSVKNELFHSRFWDKDSTHVETLMKGKTQQIIELFECPLFLYSYYFGKYFLNTLLPLKKYCTQNKYGKL